MTEEMNCYFDQPAQRRGSNCWKWDCLEEGVIPMWVADMDFQAPPAVMRRLEERVQHGYFGYGMPSEELMESFMQWHKSQYGPVLERDWVHIIPSVVPGLSVASQMLGGSAITFIPNYSHILTAPVEAGNEMIQVPMAVRDGIYYMDFDAMQAALQEDTKILYLCSPHNPVGRAFTLEELQEVSAFAKKNNLLIVSDEIHCEIVFDRKHIPFFTVDEYAKEHSITLTAPGKTYNIPGVVLAFAMIPNVELRERFQKAGFAFGFPGVLNVEAAIGAYKESQEWRVELLDYLKGNRDFLEQQLRERFPKARFTHVEATYLCWIDFSAYGDDVNGEFFLKNARVYLTYGDDFGDATCVRLNFGCPRSQLAEALDRMAASLASRSR